MELILNARGTVTLLATHHDNWKIIEGKIKDMKSNHIIPPSAQKHDLEHI